jgi:putative ABC transport system substrate-binding protein
MAKPISDLRLVISVLCALLLVLCVSVQAQQPTKVSRIGYLTGTPLSAMKSRTDAFREGLRELGYNEGKNIVIEWRSANGNRDRQRALASELVGLNVEVIVTGGPSSTRAVKEATSTIPIVMTIDFDPVGTGLIASLARPGGNITGLSTLAPELGGKRLEILQEVVPKLSRVAVFGTSTSVGEAQELKGIELAAESLRVKSQYFDVLATKEIDPAFRSAAKAGVQAILMTVAGPIGLGNRKEITELAVKHRLPVIYGFPDYVEAGGLMTYGVSAPDLYRRAAIYVDKILKGRKPIDLPVEQPLKFEFIINLKAAKQIGLTIPPNVLARADRVIR